MEKRPLRQAQDKPLPTPGFAIEELDGELLLFHPSSETILHINETGALVWRLCDGQRSAADIVETLTAVYPDAAANIAQDVPELLNQFADQGAITWA
jgi:hypothetical protein